MASAFKLGTDMPKPELSIFTGDSRDFYNFKHAFTTIIETKTKDDRLRLHYIIKYCGGVARKAIEHCAMFNNPSRGLAEAKAILAGSFGQTYDVVQAYKSPILKGPYIRPNDCNALMNLALEMQKCQLALAQLGFSADINNSDTLLKIVWKLPFHLQSKWVGRANDIFLYGREPNFNDLTEFIRGSAKLANTFYGRNIRRERQETHPTRQTYSVPRVPTRTTLATSINISDKLPAHATCLHCNDASHTLVDCSSFQSLSSGDRFKFAAAKKICHNCLLVGHLAMGCFMTSRCSHEGCRKRHNPLFHSAVNRQPGAVNVVAGIEEEYDETENQLDEQEMLEMQESRCEEQEKMEFNCNLSRGDGGTCLHVVPVRVKANGKEITTLALLDTGSDVTLCTRDMIKSLELVGKPATYNLNTINSSGSVNNGVEVALSVSAIDNSEAISLPKVWAVDSIPVSTSSIPSMKYVNQWEHLKDIEFPTLPNNAKVGLLIGSDTPEAFWVLEQRIGQRKDPYAVKTLLDWSLMGPLRRSPLSGVVHTTTHDKLLTEQVQAFWNADFRDVEALGTPEMSKNDKIALNLVEKSVIKTNSNRYCVGLPWRSGSNELSGNYSMALTRLRSLKRRLNKDQVLLEKYSTVMDDYLTKGYARMVPKIEFDKTSANLWYIPHHPVFNPEKPDKLRIVFDCAASFHNKSLNKAIYSGPDVTSSLLGVLLRFRKGRIALVGDVEAMFHQIEMQQSDWPKLSFLWWENGDLDSNPKTYQMKVHLFGATSSPFGANYCLRKTANDNAELFDHDVTNTVLRSFYVDDCLCSVDTTESAIVLRRQLTDLLKLGGFRITKWISNSREVIRSIPDVDLAPSVNAINLELTELPVGRALGIIWDTDKDLIGFKCTRKPGPLTRRGILSTISSVFDPLGIISPFLLFGKLILQDLTRKGTAGWDDPIPEDVGKRWKEWTDDLPKLVHLNLPRCLKLNLAEPVVDVQLHHFCDASAVAYGAVSYIRLRDSKDNVSCSFLIGKSRLAPTKTVSIPRLELNAATLAVKLNGLLQRELDLVVHSVHYWTDSTTVIKYLNNTEKRFHTFVANRISLIQSSSNVSDWRYVKSGENPADDATRGIKEHEFTRSCRWLNGPGFLTKPEKAWPVEIVDPALRSDDKEIKRNANVAVVNQASPTLLNLVLRHSDWNRLLRAVAWLIRFKTFIKCRRQLSVAIQGPISAEELSNAEMSIISFVQRLSYPALFAPRNEFPPVNSLNKSMRKLKPFVKDDILRVGGRLSRAPIDFNLKHPIILPKGHLARLVVRDCHNSNGHVGPSHTWTLLRQKYWVIAGGAKVRKEIGGCIRCRKRNAKPCSQIMSDLPSARVTPDKPPFDCTGVDYFGPMLVKQGRSTPKRYGCLFTCLSSRAIHLEVSADLSTASFINALKRFVSRRGCPSAMYSDNGSNFIGAEKEIREAQNRLRDHPVQNYLASKRISWHFNSPLAPHMGGVWERMVGLVKGILKSVLQEQLVTDDVLHTILLEVESIVNSRPLIPVTLDPTQEEPLSPNHLLLLHPTSSMLDNCDYEKADNYTTRRWRQVQYLSQKFWRRWTTEYLPLLHTRQKWNKIKSNLQLNDLVLMSDEGVSRRRWPLAKVVETFPGKDGKIRQVKIKTKNGIYVRPIVKLYK